MSNAAAQYWARADANCNAQVEGARPGHYQTTLYQNELNRCSIRGEQPAERLSRRKAASRQVPDPDQFFTRPKRGTRLSIASLRDICPGRRTPVDQGQPGLGSVTPPPSNQPDSRGITPGIYRGNNVLFEYVIPRTTPHAGLNSLDISAASGKAGDGFLTPGFVYDCVQWIER
nr:MULTISPECIES: polysaccharide lyase family protein [unclassified Pseudomonas]